MLLQFYTLDVRIYTDYRIANSYNCTSKNRTNVKHEGHAASAYLSRQPCLHYHHLVQILAAVRNKYSRKETSSGPISGTLCHKPLELHYWICAYSPLILHCRDLCQQSSNTLIGAGVCFQRNWFVFAENSRSTFRPLSLNRVRPSLSAHSWKCHYHRVVFEPAVSSPLTPSSHFAPFRVAFCWRSRSLVAMVGEGWHQLWFTGCTGKQTDKINELQYIRGQGLQPILIRDHFTHVEVSLWNRNSPNNLWQ